MVAAIITLTKFDTRNIAIPIAEHRPFRNPDRVASLASRIGVPTPHKIPTSNSTWKTRTACCIDPQATVHSRFTRTTRIPQASESE